MTKYAATHSESKATLTNSSESLSYSRIALQSISAQLAAIHDTVDMDDFTGAWFLTLREQLDCVISEIYGGGQ